MRKDTGKGERTRGRGRGAGEEKKETKKGTLIKKIERKVEGLRKEKINRRTQKF